MAKIKTDVAGRPLVEKLQKGKLVITKSTDNPNAPGNEALVAALAEAQAELTAAVLAATAARDASKQCTAAQAAAERKWRACLNALASFTEAMTGGNPLKMMDTGFGVRAENSPVASEPPLPVPAVWVHLNGIPGHAKVSWEGNSDAIGFLVQGSADPDTESSWVQVGFTSKSALNVNGATPGQRFWYRVAAISTAGQGPWSMPVARPVM